jgi:hypothetical protein
VAEHRLGWREPEKRDYETVYALDTFGALPGPAPVVIGVKWHTNFDRPVKDKDGSWWVGRGDLGGVRGGHCVCLKPPTMTDLPGAWQHYNQGREGACVGFGVSRAATLFNKPTLFNGFSLYHAAQKRDPFPGEAYSGTSVEAGLNTLRLDGAWTVRAGVTRGPNKAFGIRSFGWVKNGADVLKALGSTLDYVEFLNSWGMGYPNVVRMPVSVLDALLQQGGEAGVPVDLPGPITQRRAR